MNVVVVLEQAYVMQLPAVFAPRVGVENHAV